MFLHFYPLFILLKRLGVYLLIFTVCRMLFLLFGMDYFNAESPGEWIFIFAHGIRFDISAILYLSIPFIFLHILPLKSRATAGFQKMLFVLFSFMNGIMLFANLADLIYFDFTFKRSTADSLIMLVLGGDFIHIIPQLLVDFWYLIVILIVLVLAATRLYRSIEVNLGLMSLQRSPWRQVAILVLGIALVVIGGRGGLQYKPIGIIDAGSNISSQNMALVLNTPFSVITTLGKQELKQPDYFNEKELNAIYSPLHRMEERVKFPDTAHTNVVIIILESFSNEYSTFFGKNKKGYTPFLDSLAALSLSFDHCFANGKKSIEAIPAILASLPALMNNPYITSVYAGNRLEGLAALLGKKNYSTAFYHGGNNGTMGYDAFTSIAGFEKYMGRTEYNNDEHYDGNWGIYDEEYFQYFLNEMIDQQEPFFNCFATLSSHHPYAIPDRYKDKFEEGTQDIHQSLLYADYALQRFFEEASKTEWYGRTLFVLTADHTENSEDPYYLGRAGMYAIPLIFFKPNSELKGLNARITQHIDIMPSILDYLGYDEEYLCFGQSVFNDKEGFSVNFLSEIYQIFIQNYLLQFDGQKSVALFNYEEDGILKNNLLPSEEERALIMETKLKAIIQAYNQRLTENQLIAK